MKTDTFVLLIFCFTSLLSGSNMQSPELHFKTRVYQAIEALRNNDTQSMLNLVHKDSGLIIIHRPGVFNFYQQFQQQQLEKKMPNYWPDFSELESPLLRYESQPIFSCDDYRWNKTGLFCDTTTIDRLLSETAKSRIRYDLGEVSEMEISSHLKLENISRKVMLTDNNHKSLLFSLSLIDDEWYLTLLDLVTDDCDS